MPSLGEVVRRSPTFARWWANVQGREGCWEWTGSFRPNGYGQVTVRPKNWLAHRLMYAIHVGPLDPALTIDHLCRNKRCGNPAHLEQVTARVNILRGDTPARRNAERTHCPKGHPYAGANLYRYKTSLGTGARACRACKLAAQNLRRPLIQHKLSAQRMARYRNDPVFRERIKAIQRDYNARKRQRAADHAALVALGG